MKKLTLALSLLTVLGAASCKKDDKKGSSDSGNSWTIDGKSFNYNASQKMENSYVISAQNTAGALTLMFDRTPTPGTYDILDGNTVGVLGDDKVGISYSVVNASPMYGGEVTGGGKLVVTASGDKLNFKATGLTGSKIPAGTLTSTASVPVTINVTF